MDDVTGNLFSLFCSTWHAVLKMFVRLFRIEASESFGKSLEAKKAIDYLTMPKLQEIFTTVAIVCLRYERLAVLQNVFAIILL